MAANDSPHGFVLSDAALYAFECQDVFPDILSFSVAIPDHLKPLFLIPIRLESSKISRAASLIVNPRIADDFTPSGNTGEADLFGTKTFVYDDREPTVPSSSPGSIFDISDADNITHHQEYDFDQNMQVPSETSFMSDVDMNQYQSYPYRTTEKPVRHSSLQSRVFICRLALKPESLESHAPSKIKNNANRCSVKLVSYDKRGRVFTFNVGCGNRPKTVRTSLSSTDEIAMSCTCPFWRWNGPEFHANNNRFLLGGTQGSASVPDERDPNREFWLCKHAYAVLKHLTEFVQQVSKEHSKLDPDEILNVIDKEWDRLEGVAEVPLEEIEEDSDIEVDWDEPDATDDEGESGLDKESEDLEEDSDQEPDIDPLAKEDSELEEEQEPIDEDEDEDE